MFDCIRDFPRVRSGDLSHRVRLTNNEQILHFPDVVLSVVLYRAPRRSWLRLADRISVKV